MKHKNLEQWASRNELPTTHEAVAQMLNDTRQDDVPLYLANDPYFLSSVLVPNELLQGNFADDIAEWNTSVPSGFGWGFKWVGSEWSPYLSDPLHHTFSEILNQGTAPLFVRYLEGRGSYVEMNQRLTHVLDLHERGNSTEWCRLNELGELVPTVRVTKTPELGLCTIDRGALNRYLVAADMSLVRLLVVNTAPDPKMYMSKTPVQRARPSRGDEVFLQATYVENQLVQVRGFDVVRTSPIEKARALQSLQGKEPRQYATFIIEDTRNERVIDWSSDPSDIGNYFEDSKLPFGLSPAFFKPDIINIYRTDPGRFQVRSDRVECAGAWFLPYYVNEEGLVHAYLCDLARLPFTEQLKWKAYNVSPNGGLARQAIERDFMARWSTAYNPLLSLGEALRSFPVMNADGSRVRLWSLGELPPGRDLDFLGYVVTDVKKEFEDQISALVQIVVEGFHKAEINRLGDLLGCRDQALGSLRQLGKVLECLKVPSDVIETILNPLLEIQKIRSSSIAHRGSVRIDGDQRQVFREILGRCDQAMREVATLVKQGLFNLSSKSAGAKKPSSA